MSWMAILQSGDLVKIDSLIGLIDTVHINTIFHYACKNKLGVYVIGRIMFEDGFDGNLLAQNKYCNMLFSDVPPAYRNHLRSLLYGVDGRNGYDIHNPSLFEALMKLRLTTLFRYTPLIRSSHIISVLSTFTKQTNCTYILPTITNFNILKESIITIYTKHLHSKRIGNGAYGSVYRPVLGCKGEVGRTDNYAVGKVMSPVHAWNEEQLITSLPLSELDPQRLYHVPFIRSCIPALNNLLATTDKHYISRSDSKMLIYEYGGITLRTLLASRKIDKHRIISALHELFKWVVRMNISKGIYHMDIKADNIVCNVVNGNIRCRLIDFGMAVTCTDKVTPRPRKIYTSVYTWPFEIMLYATTTLSIKQRIALYSQRYGYSTNYMATVKYYKKLVKYTQRFKSERNPPIELIKELFSFVDVFQFAIMLSNPSLLGRSNHCIRRILNQEQPLIRPSIVWVLQNMFIS